MRRGSDHSSLYKTDTSDTNLSFFSSVLHLRGPSLVPQPVVSAEGDVLCYNGQIFEGLPIDPQLTSDTKVIWNLLTEQVSQYGEQGIRDALARLEGPYAIVYYQAATQTLYYARDPLGRRSLLVSTPSGERSQFVLASVGETLGNGEWAWEEVGCESLWKVSLSDTNVDNLYTPQTVERFISLDPVNSTIPPASFTVPLLDSKLFPAENDALNEAADRLIIELDESVKRRVENIPALEASNCEHPPARLAILFSGGLDCTVIALLADRYIPTNEPIDLLNVGFENPRSLANQLKASTGPKKVKIKGKGKQDEATLRNGSPEECIGRVEPYQAPRSVDSDEERRTKVYGVPDRKTGWDTLAELRELRPTRTWNFVEIDVPYEECTRLTPVSLALALYFASRGEGTVVDSTTRKRSPYISQAKVLLSGLGADEQLGGYGRHRRAYELGGWSGLIDEIQMDITRLPTRNLGRDDRVISTHSKEARFPYLSLSFIRYLSRIPIQTKCDFRYAEPRKDSDEAIGDKILLRLAADRLGLKRTRGKKKRAMQFGSRSAKMDGQDEAQGGSGGGMRRRGMGAEKLGAAEAKERISLRVEEEDL
ncbi:Asparagine synthase [Phaffia rhodozyma]|uniref:Asparagine synthase n=1 Tax=Phaffia rhodozyma TaxID=264483 RepID=A0A0F7SV82_PHARH|nr:Asparagine synthase [Phaffia rhodozyma]